MSIYDPILQAYQGGIDRNLAIQQQRPSLVQAILGGYGQGREWKRQDDMLALQQAQLAEQQRHRQMQEEEARQWHQGQLADRLTKQASDTVFQAPEQAMALRTLLQRRAGMSPDEAAGLAPIPQKDPYAKGTVTLPASEDASQWSEGEKVALPAEPLQPGTQGYEGEYIPEYGSKSLQRQQEFERRAQHDQDMNLYRKGRLDLNTTKALTASGVAAARINQINEAIRLGKSLEPFKKELMAAQAWRAYNPPESVTLGAGGGQTSINQRTMAEILKRAAQLQSTSEKQAQEWNDSIEGIKTINKNPGARKKGLSSDEALQLALKDIGTIAKAGSTPGTGLDVRGGGLDLVPTPTPGNPKPKPKPAATRPMGSIRFRYKGTGPGAGQIKDFNILKDKDAIKKLRNNPDFEEVD